MYVFVYGTLKRGCPNHYVLEDRNNGVADYYCDGKTVELFPLIIATKYEVPFLLDKSGCGKNVQGEVYRVDEKMLTFLDGFEKVPEVYSRREAEFEINLEKGGSSSVMTAWIFVFHSFKTELLDLVYWDAYICNNYDVLRSISGKVGPEEKSQLLATLRN